MERCNKNYKCKKKEISVNDSPSSILSFLQIAAQKATLYFDKFQYFLKIIASHRVMRFFVDIPLMQSEECRKLR